MKKAIYAIIGLLFLGWTFCFTTVEQEEFAVVFRLGQPIRAITEPGIYFSWPFETIEKVDNRLKIYDSAPQDVITSNKQTLAIDNFALYGIKDPILYLRQVKTPQQANSILDDIVYSALRNLIGENKYEKIVSNRDDLMQEAERYSDGAVKKYGLNIVLVMLNRVDLPTENMQAVMERMISDCESRAEAYLADGKKEAQTIKAKADFAVKKRTSEGWLESLKIKANGENEAASIYNAAYGQNPKFYEFMKSLETAKITMQGDNVRFLMDGEQGHLKALFDN